MRIEKFEDLAVAIDDKIAIWFRKTHRNDKYGWAFIRANEDGKSWRQPEIGHFKESHPGVLDDVLRRLNNG